MKIYDISVTLSDRTPIYPGDPRIEIVPESRISAGDSANLSTLRFGSHTGTHVDPPFHFVSNGATIDRVSLYTLFGECLVCRIDDPDSIRVAELERADIPDGTKRIIFKTRNSDLWESPAFAETFVFLNPEAAEWLIRRGLQVVGIDYLSVDPFKSATHPTHTALLNAGVAIIEGLDLRGVPQGTYTLACLPLKIAGGDGGPSRAILIEDRE
jgi:arylformamidase